MIEQNFTYRDPLLKRQFLTNTRVGPSQILTNNIDINSFGDWILYCYVHKLTAETFKPMPNFLGDTKELAEAYWVEDDLSTLRVKYVMESRKHGWCVVQFYEQDDPVNPRWRVFSVQQWVDWIRDQVKQADGTFKNVRSGAKFTWGDDIQNEWNEDVLFDSPTTFLIKYQEGDGMSAFSLPDLNQALMTLVFELRQIKGQMTFSSAKPLIWHFVYGLSADDDNTDELDNKVSNIDSTTAIGISKEVLEEIRTIPNDNTDVIIPAYQAILQAISGICGVPVSYFNSEKPKGSGSGMSDVGEKSDHVDVRQKKQFLFNHYNQSLIDIYRDVYGIDIEAELPQEETFEEIEEKQNGQESKDIN
jgi:hypothetical protein